jgi:cobalt-zinc-cadmium efflux system membrane fusion protein
MTTHVTETPTDTNGPNATPPTTVGAGPLRRMAAALAWLARVVPTLLVLGALGGLAAWGHHTGWKVPKFSAMVGHAPAPEEGWCEAHNVPEAECVECNPNLLPRGKVPPYCKKHGVPECPLDHPEIAQVTGRPQFPRYDVLAALALLDRPENNSKCKLHERRIQFASAAAADKAGVDVDVVREAPMTEFVAASGEVGYDQTRLARLSSRVPGTVWRVDRQVGDPVREGDLLALVDAAEVGKAKAEFLQALAHGRLRAATLERLQAVERSGAVPEHSIREAEMAASEARIRIRAAQQALVNLGMALDADDLKGLSEAGLADHVQFLGLPRPLAERLDPKRTTANLLPIAAPFDGVVVGREVVAGEVVDAAKVLFVIADPRRVWLTLNVRQEDARRLKLGQPVRFHPDGDAEEAAGKVAWISTAVDEKTRTVKVRADLENPDGRLRAGAFGPGRVVLRSEPYAVVVPKEAVHSDGDCQVVFVRDKDYLKEGAPKVFHVRKVRPGARDEQHVEVLAGVLPGEVVAVKGSAVLQAELLKGKLGEG